MTLEEYLDFLKEKKKLQTDVEGKKYTVSYYKSIREHESECSGE